MDQATALAVLGIAAKLIVKAHQVLSSGEPQTIEEEVKALDAARLRPSEEIIKEADGKK